MTFAAQNTTDSDVLSPALRIVRWLRTAPKFMLILWAAQCVVLPAAAFVYSKDIYDVGAQVFNHATTNVHKVVGSSEELIAAERRSTEAAQLKMDDPSNRRLLGISFAIVALVGTVLTGAGMALNEEKEISRAPSAKRPRPH
jgi:hypothetical protein